MDHNEKYNISNIETGSNTHTLRSPVILQFECMAILLLTYAKIFTCSF